MLSACIRTVALVTALNQIKGASDGPVKSALQADPNSLSSLLGQEHRKKRASVDSSAAVNSKQMVFCILNCGIKYRVFSPAL